jgi:hypothetical protein
LFPSEGLKPAVIPITIELVDEVRRVDEILKTWLDRVSDLTSGLQENVEKINAADLPEALPICRESPAQSFLFIPSSNAPLYIESRSQVIL